ncbi:VOC family protein [Rhizomonospora bruguierae]|uniref:VOC family protein n=1 Tax=Rhizomonospora bruguierae TaxID=1581705 RepID=UPI001BCFC96D|nr:VOC family protein [Micromonospora sp. NBRC 107566]
MTDNFPAPAGTHSLTTYLSVAGCAAAMEFYREAFGAAVVHRMTTADGVVMHAEMRLGDSTFQLGEASAGTGLLAQPENGNAFTMTFWTAEVDHRYERAVKLGATAVSPVADTFSGDRMGVLRCPAGVRWCLARHDRDVPAEEIEAAARRWIAANPAG